MHSLTAQDALSKLWSHITALLSGARNIYAQHPVLTVSASVAAVLFPLAARNFRMYQALGQGGFSNVFVGWIGATLLKPFGRNTTRVKVYDADADKDFWLKAGDGPAEVPLRGRPRPAVGWHFIPHRQLDQYSSEKIQELITREFRTVAETNSDLVQVGLSPHERFSDALMVHVSVPSPHHVAELSRREIGHIHYRKDFSLHVTLAPQDCKLVIEQGWGERHPLSGVVSSALPKEYLMIYAPLTEDDVRVVGLIMRASVGYMTGSRNVH